MVESQAGPGPLCVFFVCLFWFLHEKISNREKYEELQFGGAY